MMTERQAVERSRGYDVPIPQPADDDPFEEFIRSTEEKFITLRFERPEASNRRRFKVLRSEAR